MKSPLADDLLEIHEHASYDENYPAAGLIALRLATGLSRDDVCEVAGILPPLLELHEDFGGWPDMDAVVGLAMCYGCTPGELVDAVACLCEAQQHDLPTERETRRQADRLLALLRSASPSPIGGARWVMNDWMETNGVPTNNYPFNDLYDRGYPVEIVRDRSGKPLGVRLRREET